MHFQSEYNHENKWLRTTITVSEKTEPYYRLYTGGVNRRFKLANKQHTVFWGCIEKDYSGVSLFRNTTSWQNPIVEPIKSASIEHYKSLKLNPTTSINHYEYWANYFAKGLLKTQYSLLHIGSWTIKAGVIGKQSKSEKELLNTQNVHQNDGVFLEQIEYIDWGINGSGELIASKYQPPDESARVKWWRKKVKENACPPVLAWFVSPLDAYLIIDGHSRLRAYQLEDMPIQLLILSAYLTEKPSHEDLVAVRQRFLISLKSRINDKRKNICNTLSIDRINAMLIEMYDNEYEKYITIGTPVAEFDKIWENEVSQFKTDTSINQTYLKGLLSSEI